MSVKEKVKDIKPVLNEIKYLPMDDLEIKQFLPTARIIKYSELSKVRDLDQILPQDKDFIIILFESEKNRGHWVSLMKDRNLINYFDSFGRPIDAHLNDIPLHKRRQLDSDIPHLTNLLKKEIQKGRRVVYNKVQYQGGGDGIATCGRHTLFRLLHFLNGKDDEDYYKHMNRIKDKYGLTYDQIVSFEIPE